VLVAGTLKSVMEGRTRKHALKSGEDCITVGWKMTDSRAI
jgi:hypothetical protein